MDAQNPGYLIPKTRRFKITDYNIYENELQNEMNQHNITRMISKIQSCNNKFDLNNIIKSTTELYTKTSATVNSIRLSSNKRQNNKNKAKLQTNRKSWYDNECTSLKRQLNQINKAVNRNPTNENRRHIFFKTQKKI